MSNSQIDIENLYDWLEQQPELAHLREQAAATPCEYRPAEPTPQLRLTTNAISELPAGNTGVIAKLWEIVWVPGRNIRGKAFSTPELDASLSSVAKLMCISTLWDFVTTIPLFSFSLGLFGSASVPAGTALSFILLWASNVAGENATDRRPRHAAKANWSLAAFILLSSVKTLSSGVGVDLMISNEAIAAGYAQKLAVEKIAKDNENLGKQSKPDQSLIDARQACQEAMADVQRYNQDRDGNNAEFISAYVRANGTNADNSTDKGLTNEELSKKYNVTKGACLYQKALEGMLLDKNKDFRESVTEREKFRESMPPLAYLEKYEPELFNAHFRNNGDKVEWVNGSEAVGEAFDQFFSKLLNPKQISLLGFSLFSLMISVILTGAASIMLYMAGKNPQVQASFTGDLERYRNNRLSDYEKLAKQEEA